MYGSRILRNSVIPIHKTLISTYTIVENKPYYSQYCHYVQCYCELYPNTKTTHCQITEIYQSVQKRLACDKQYVVEK